MGLSMAAVIFAIVSIQVGASIAKGLFPLVGAEGATTLRLVFAALMLIAVARPWRGALSRSQINAVVVYGAALGLMNLSFYEALERIPLGVAVALEFTGPLAVALIASKRALDFIWAGLAIAGLMLLLPLTEISAAIDPVGAGFALLAGFCWALYILFGQKAGARIPGIRAIALGQTVAALVVLPFGIAHSGTELLNPSLLPLGLAVAVLSSALPYTLEMIGLRNMPTQTFGILMSLEPAVAAIAGLLILSEQLTLLQWAAVACVMIASAGSALSAGKKPEVAPVAVS